MYKNLQTPSLIRTWFRRSIHQVCFCLLLGGFAYGHDSRGQVLQDTYVSLNVENTQLKKVLGLIEEQTRVSFVYSSSSINVNQKVSLSASHKSLDWVLNALLKPLSVSYTVKDNRILLKSEPKQSGAAPAAKPENSGMAAPADRTLNGKVTDEEGGSLPGVSVLVKGTQRGTVTDQNGQFQISVTDRDQVLVFSFVGYTSQEVPISNSSTYTVKLAADIKALSEVVVIGYGTQKKSDLTGAVSSVNSDQLTAYPALDAVQALQGRAAGVQIQATNGEPGAGFKIRVRGATSINASSDPLIVVDGMVGGVMPPPEDIASIEVLKDASSTAIYGSRGANGVVMVTTKSGANGKPQITLNSSFSTQKEVGRLAVLNARDYAKYINEARNTNYYDVNNPEAETDWQDLIFRQGFIRNNQLSVSGGGSNVKYYVSAAMFDQQGIIKTSEYSRISLNSKISIDATNRLTIGINTFLRRGKQDGIYSQHPNGANDAGVIASAQRFEPNRGILDNRGIYTTSNVGTAPYENPMAVIDGRTIENVDENMQTNLQLRYKILDDLFFNSTLGIGFTNRRNGQYNNRISSEGLSANGSGILSTGRRLNLINENYFNYSKTLAGQHTLGLAAGYSYQKFNAEDFSASNRGFITDAFGFWNLDAGSNWQPASSNTTTSEIVSYYARLNYNFRDRYLFTATGRYDGASQFSDGNKWSFFPSGAFAWNVSNEDFFPENNLISSLKLRTSYGLTGNQAIGPYQSLSRISPVLFSFGSSVVNAVRPTAIANKDLTWETTAQFDIGADLDLLGGRINVSGDYYNKQTSDLLFTVPIPSFSGYSNRVENLGKIENKGFEFLVNSRNLVNAFKWSTSFNLTINRNKVLALPGGLDREFSSGPGVLAAGVTSILREGQPVGSFYGYIYDGVYQTSDEIIPGAGFEKLAGGEKFRDLNKDGQLSTLDRTIIGNPNPDYIWGLNNDVSFKNFDLSVFFQASMGGDIYNFTKMELDRLAGITNATTDALRRWTPENTNTNVPKAVTGRTNRSSTRFVEDGTYIRLKNLALGYTFSPELLKRIRVRNARLFVSAQNILTFTNYSGVDPEVAYKGQGNLNLGGDYDSYPNVKSYTIGLNLGF
ncbi:TonB-dependent receptor [Telluribacter sp.]|jgi:TonB-linked SusC/RagA family outer membrane protein|uniref:TonB-dependent receptor n=1 Tax=Telluribacter sp. TaxID=1978767 RepID=UPI002E0F98D2|nr:TonB-dependent receptor [Telluribacter sp.]